MKNISIATLCFVFAAEFTSLARAQVPLTEMTDTINRRGIAVFVEGIRSNHWKTPFIPSRWYQEKAVSQNEKDEIAAARDFGLKLARALSEFAPQLHAPMSTDDLVKQTGALIDLGAWCASKDGLENILLAQRCNDLAYVSFVRLVADLDIPIGVVDDLHGRFGVDWLTPKARAQVLNKEARAQLFDVDSLDASKAQQQLELVWKSGRYFLLERNDPALKAARMGDEKNAGKYADKVAAVVKFGKEVVDNPELQKNLDFFEDDTSLKRHQKKMTLVGQWDEKWHQHLIVGLELQNAEKVEALFTFRKVVGDFPAADNPHSTWRGGEGAFSEEWKSRISRKPNMTEVEWNRYRNLNTLAWSAYNEMKHGEFVDMDKRNENQ